MYEIYRMILCDQRVSAVTAAAFMYGGTSEGGVGPADCCTSAAVGCAKQPPEVQQIGQSSESGT